MKKIRLSLEMTVKSLLLFMLVSAVTFNIVVPQVHGQTTEIRVINPETNDGDFEFYTNTIRVGTPFNVTLYVHDVIDLYTFQASLKYNSSVLNATRAWIPEDDAEYVFVGRSPVITGPYFYYDDPVHGTSVLVGSTLFDPVSGFDGTGLLAIIEFEIIDEPKVGEAIWCGLNINNTKTFLLDSSYPQMDIDADKIDGYYQYEWAAPSTYLVTGPQHYETSKLESFNITVWLNNTVSIQELVYVKFELSYSAELLTVTQVFEGSFLAEYGDTTFSYTIEAGSVSVESRLANYTSFPVGDGEIAIMTFQGVHQGIEERYCSLRFVNTQFLNDNEEDVAVILLDGSYKIAGAAAGITLNVHSDDWIISDYTYIVIRGAEVVLNGSITPVIEGVNVSIYCSLSGFVRSEWTRYTVTDSNGHYEYVWTANESDLLEAPLTFQAKWEEGFDVIAESEVWSYLEILSTVQQSEITITVKRKFVVVGRNATITGVIEQIEMTNHDPVNVTIYYRFANETNGWTELVTVKTDSKGRYSYQWTVQQLGKYKVKASWLGDRLLRGDESDEKSLEVVETLPLDIMAYLPYIIGAIVILVIVILYFKKFRS